MKNKLLIFLTIFLVGVSVQLAMKIQLLINLEKDTKDFMVTNKLREYTYLNSPWSSESLNIKKEIWNKNSSDIFELLKRNKGGLDCSGIASVLMKSYSERGYETYTYHSGKLTGGFTHVVTLVRIRHKGKYKLIIQDPTYNVTYIDQYGEPLDFFDFLELIKKKQYEKFSLLRNNDLYHTYLCSMKDKALQLCDSQLENRDMKRINDDIFLYKEKAFVPTLTEYVSIYLSYRDIYSGNQLLFPAGKMEKKILGILSKK